VRAAHRLVLQAADRAAAAAQSLLSPGRRSSDDGKWVVDAAS